MKKYLLLILLFPCLGAHAKDMIYTFSGKINNKYAIHMRFSVDENDKIRGSYYYLSAFIPIELNGMKKGNTLSINETSESGTTAAVFKGTLQNNIFSGTWIKSNGQSMPFALSQKDWIAPQGDDISGTYTIGMTKEEEKDNEIPAGEHGYSGTICCLMLPNGKIGFCLSYNKGYPGYHMGELQGIATAKGNGVYEYNKLEFDGAEKPCHILFTFKDQQLIVDQQSEDGLCGFGAFVDISGTYKKENRKFGIEFCIY